MTRSSPIGSSVYFVFRFMMAIMPYLCMGVCPLGASCPRLYVYCAYMKKRITIYLDEGVVERFKSRAAETGAGYQTMINETLKQALPPEGELPKKRSLAEVLMAMPEIVGHDDIFDNLRVPDVPD